MSSETSTELNIKYLDSNGKKINTMSEKPNGKFEIKRQSSDTDYYFDMVANQDKMVPAKSETSSELENMLNSSESKKSSSSSSSSRRSSSSKHRIDNINLNSSPEYKPDFMQVNHHKTDYNHKTDYKQSNTTNIPHIEPTVVPIQQLSPQEIRMKKIELLRRLSEIKAKGFSLTKDYDFSSSIEEMEYEYGLLKSFADKRNGTKLYKNILLNGISLVEFLNDKYDPFDFKLTGWSEHMSIEIDSYEDIIEELYEKYKSTGKTTPPEIRLIFLIMASGAAFHFSKTQLGNIPGVSSAATGMIGKMMSNKKQDSQFMSAQEINLEKQKQLLREKEKQQKVNKQSKQMNNQQQFNNQMNNQQQFNNQMNNQQQFNNQMNNQMNNQQQFNPPVINQQFKSTSRDIPEIRAPNNVQDILNRIKQQNTNVNSTETEEESTINDRLVSDSTVSDAKKKKRQPKKSLISINTK
jgi:hypothetical protein